MKKFFTLLLCGVVLSISAQQVSFAPYIVHTTTGSMFEFVTSGDVDGDGDTDIVGATSSYFDPNNDYSLFVWLNNNGVLSTIPIKAPYYGGTIRATAIAIGDLDDSPGQEIVLTLASGDVQVWKYWFTGGHNLGNVFTMHTYGNLPDGVDIGDVDSDGKNDIAVSHWNSPWISILYKTGDTISFIKIDYPMANAGYDQILVKRLGQDTTNSIIYMRGQGLLNDVEILKVNSNRNIVSTTSVNITGTGNQTAAGIAVGDPYGDGNNVLSISSDYNTPDALIATWKQTTSSIQNDYVYHIPETVRYANVDGIVGDELLVLHGGWTKLSVITNIGLPTSQIYQFNLPYASHYQPTGMTTGDFNADGKIDIAIADYNQGLVILYNTTSTLGVIDHNEVSIGIYPNPTTDFVTVKSNTEISSISVYDLHGRKIQEIQNTVVDFSKESQGVYLLVITQKDGKMISKKIVKK